MTRSMRRPSIVRTGLAAVLALTCFVTLSAGLLQMQAVAGVADTAGSLQDTLLTQGEQHQVIRFNPGAALQKRIFADSFVPNSPEFTLQVSGTSYTAERAENLASGQVRVYYVAVGDWGNVHVAERGRDSGGTLGGTMLAAGEQHQLIRFNPGAALQKDIFAGGFVPNSAEFGLQVNPISYLAQRAENLASGEVRVYYAILGDWGNVHFVTRGAPQTPVPPTPQPAGGWTVSTRLWSVIENGGSFSGPTINCGYGRNIHVTVLDENGARLNGIAVRGVWTGIVKITGSDGKGDGNVIMDFPLHSGEQVQLRDHPNAISPSLEIDPQLIPKQWLLAAGYCSNINDCPPARSPSECLYHFSYDVIFRRY